MGRRSVGIKGISFVFLIAVGFVGRASLWAQVPPPFESPPAITEVEARRFIDQYVEQYIKMDIDSFMTFFSNGAIENRMLTYGDIREVYRMTFDNSESLKYDLEISTIQIFKDGAAVTGRYEVIQALKGTPYKKVYRGNIQWDLIREDGVLKIKEINYGRDYRWDRPWHPYP
ncbi:MAG: hypothetical protein ACUVWO_10535 [Thermodesulfobacteriota bacterium]